MNAIRKFSAEDIPAIHQILIEGVKAWAGENYENIKDWYVDAYSMSTLTSNLVNTTRTTYVSQTSDGEIIGTISAISKGENHYHIGGLYVLRQGEGIGSELLGHALSVLPVGTKVTADIWYENLSSIQFFIKHGFSYLESSNNYDTYTIIR